MMDVRGQIIDSKYKDARRITKPSGPPTAEESAWREKVIRMTLETISASANKFIEYGVAEEDAFRVVFNAISDKTLDRMMDLISQSEMKKLVV